VYANYLLIAYAFLLPTFPKAASVVMILIGFLAFTAEDVQNRFIRTVKDKIIIAFLLFYFMHITWLFGSEHITSALLKLKDFKYILYIVILAMVIKEEFIKKILYSFLMAIAFSVLTSYAMFLNLQIPLIYLNSHPYIAFSVPFMLSYTQYGSILSLSAGISFFFFLKEQNSSNYLRFFYLVLFIAISVDVFIIPSRIGHALYFISIAVVVLSLYHRYFYRSLIVIILISTIVFSIAYQYSNDFASRVNTLSSDIHLLRENNFSTSMGIRAGYYVYGLKVIAENVYVGVGIADHIPVTAEKIRALEKNPVNLNALLFATESGHNASFESEFLDITLQFGVIGLLVFLNIFYQIIKYPTKLLLLKTIQFLLIGDMLFLSVGSVIFIASDIGKIFILLTALTLLPKTTTPPSPQKGTSSTS
jgi:O-antigen ligase